MGKASSIIINNRQAHKVQNSFFKCWENFN